MPPRLAADAVLLFITAIWGLSFMVVQDALGAADPYTFLALRFGVGALALTVLSGRAMLRPGMLGPALLLGVLLFLGYAFQTWGLTATTTSRSAFITGMCVLLVPPLSFLLFRVRPKLPSLVGVLLASVGVAVLTGGLSAETQSAATLRGDVLTLGCALCFGLHIVITERYSPGRPALALVGLQLWVVALLSAAVLPFTSVRLESSGSLWGAVLVTGLFASALAIGLQTWAQARTSAVRAALLFSSEPVFAALFAYALRGEALTRQELLGGSLILLAILLAELGNVLLARRRVTVAGI